MPAAWYIDAFTADYLDVYPHRDDASAEHEAHAVLGFLRLDPTRGRVLDLAAGTGRHALALARLRCRVTALDLSEDLIARCAERGLRAVRGDMRALPFGAGRFAAVTVFFSSFGYFARDEEHLRVLEEVRRVLAPGGGAFLDLMDPDTVAASLEPQSIDIVDGRTVEVERRLVDDGRRVEKSVRLLRRGSAPRAWTESVRLFTGEEISTLAHRAGLSVEATWGDYDGREHARGRTRRLLVLRRSS